MRLRSSKRVFRHGDLDGVFFTDTQREVHRRTAEVGDRQGDVAYPAPEGAAQERMIVTLS
jgi:hypothetical protein